MKFLSQLKAEEVFFVNTESYFSVIAGINIVSVFVHLPYGLEFLRSNHSVYILSIPRNIFQAN